MADIFQEIDEQLRQDRAADLWRRFRYHAIAAAILVVVAVGAYRYWIYHDLTTRAADSARYLGALSQENEGGDAIEAFGALAQDAGRGYAVLGRLKQAAAAAEQGDREGALIAYRALADDADVPSALRDLARVKWAGQKLADGRSNELDLTLDALAVAGNPWRPLSLELKAVLALQSGDTAMARTLFAELADDATASAGLRQRAAEVLKVLGKG